MGQDKRGNWVYNYYYEYPGSIWFTYYNDAETKRAAIVGWKLKYNEKTYSGECIEDFVEFVKDFKKNVYNDYYKGHKLKIIVLSTKLRRTYQFLKNYFNCTEPFVIKNAVCGTFTIEDFIEFREVKAILGPDWEDISDADNEVDILYDASRLAISKFNFKFGPIKGKIPLTTQQYISQLIEEGMTEEDKERIFNLFPSREEYIAAREKLYVGGYCDKGDPYGVVSVKEQIGHVDFKSSYLARLLTEYYPMTRFEPTDISELEDALQTKCCIIRLKVYNLRARKIKWLVPGKMLDIKEYKTDFSGRIKTAEEVELLVNELDFGLIGRCYSFTKYEILALYTAERGQLPKYVRNVAEQMFENRMTTKGIDKFVWKLCTEIVYGATVKKIHDFDKKQWEGKDGVVARAILSPYWGIWCSSHARYALVDTILIIGEDFIYGDTDSMFFTNPIFYSEILRKQNDAQRRKMKEYCEENNRNFELFKDLGCWKWEENSTPDKATGVRFKSTGPKRYIFVYEDDNNNLVLVDKIAGFAEVFDSGRVDENGEPIYVKAFEYWYGSPDNCYDEIFEAFKDNTVVKDYRKTESLFDDECQVYYNGRLYNAKGGVYTEEGLVKISIRKAYEQAKDIEEAYKLLNTAM